MVDLETCGRAYASAQPKSNRRVHSGVTPGGSSRRSSSATRDGLPCTVGPSPWRPGHDRTGSATASQRRRGYPSARCSHGASGGFWMATIGWRVWLVVPVAMAVSWSGSATAGQSPAQRCEARKNLAVGAKAECVAGEYAREAQGGTPNFDRCETAFTKAFEAAERQARPGGCPTEGDTAAIEAMVDTCMGDIAAALAGNRPSPPCPPAQLPATGQTRCWNSAGRSSRALGRDRTGPSGRGGPSATRTTGTARSPTTPRG